MAVGISSGPEQARRRAVSSTRSWSDARTRCNTVARIDADLFAGSKSGGAGRNEHRIVPCEDGDLNIHLIGITQPRPLLRGREDVDENIDPLLLDAERRDLGEDCGLNPANFALELSLRAPIIRSRFPNDDTLGNKGGSTANAETPIGDAPNLVCNIPGNPDLPLCLLPGLNVDHHVRDRHWSLLR